jgi:3-oxoacyl-[acyl-carrier protein] reductase
MPVYEDLKGRVALVTGASSGIGRATAIALATSAAKVAVNFWNNEDGAADTVAAIEKLGGYAWAVRADVSCPKECRVLVEAVQRRFGALHVLVNNAGSLVERLGLLEMTEERWDAVQNLNLKSAFLCTKAATPIMLQQKHGVIVNVASIAARNGGGWGVSHYAAAKAGLIAFSKNVARELAPQGIRVNCISPGFIDTPFHEQFSTAEIKKTLLASIPMGRAGTPEETAEVVAFLCSNVSSYVCGETIEINGGLLML